MILQWGYQAFGRKPEFVFGSGPILRRSGTDSALSVTLVGLWSHVSPIDIHTEQPYIDAQAESRYIDQ